jgi:4-amino-4-deoxy-L-arabinose transferase-like glycosyltransferase
MPNATLGRPRALPQRYAAPSVPAHIRDRVASLAGEQALVAALVAVGLVAHGLNMFHYPSFTLKDDEGIYAEQAWSVLREGHLTPYTYWYDHAPAGWIMIAGWMGLTGGPGTFGGAINSGRVLMLLLHLAMIPLLYHLARKLGCAPAAAAFGILLFSLSPLALYYQRQLLLDTIMLFWILVGLTLILDGWGRLSRVILSGICFGLAMLSKETAVFLLPALFFLALQQRWQHHGRFAMSGWLLPLAAVISWYPLYALLKGELFPAGQWTSSITDANAHVSLLGALIWQSSRSGGGLFNLNNDFWQLVWSEWITRDAFLFTAGAVASGLNILRGIAPRRWRDRRALVAGLLGALPLAYLARGGVVYDYYIVAVIPFLCLNLAVLLSPLLARLSPPRAGALLGVGTLALVTGYWAVGSLPPLFQEQPDRAGREATAWIKAYLPAQSAIVMRDDFGPICTKPTPTAPLSPTPTATRRWRWTRRSASACSTTIGKRSITSSCRRASMRGR